MFDNPIKLIQFLITNSIINFQPIYLITIQGHYFSFDIKNQQQDVNNHQFFLKTIEFFVSIILL